MKTTENTLSSAMTSSARQWNEEYCCRCCRLAQLVTKMKMKKKKEIMREREREKETEEFGPERNNNNNNNYNYSYNKPMWFWFLPHFSLFSFLFFPFSLSFLFFSLSLSLSLSLSFHMLPKTPLTVSLILRRLTFSTISSLFLPTSTMIGFFYILCYIVTGRPQFFYRSR